MATDHIRLRAFFLHLHRSANAMASDPEADWHDAERIENELDREALRQMRQSRPRLGVYGRNQFYIRLNLPASLIDDTGALVASPDNETLALFAHEYAHFMQNTSTISGWDSYERHTELLRIFSNALTDDGFCEPSLLAPESIGRVRELLTEERRAGGPGSIEHRGTTTTIAVDGVAPHCGSPDCCQVTWRCADRGGNSETIVSSIGSRLIEEGLAYLLESAARTGHATFHECASLSHSPPPIFPYIAYQELCRYLAPSVTPSAAIRVGVLALNMHRPGCGLLKVLASYERLRSRGHDDDSACSHLYGAVRDDVCAIVMRVRREARSVPEMFAERALLENGSQQIAAWFDAGLSHRVRLLDFDVRWAIGAAFDAHALNRLLIQVRPCDIFQERPWLDGEPQRDLWLASPEQSDATRNGLRALQAQLHYMRAHLRDDGFCSTEAAGARPCPYYTSCTMQMRNDDPATCARHPWAVWRRNPTCIYGAGVAGTLARANIDLES